MNSPKPSWQDKNLIIEELKKNIVIVNFTKVNGEERNMTCTLLPHLLPVHETNTENPANFPEPYPAVKENPDVVRCYDLSARGWRSFRVDSINTIAKVVNSGN